MKTSYPHMTSTRASVCKPGDIGRVYTRFLWHPCTILCILRDRALGEYTVTDPVRQRPCHTALVFIDATQLYFRSGPTTLESAYRDKHPGGRQDLSVGPRYLRIQKVPVTYKNLGRQWLEAVVSQCDGWVGNSSAGQVPTAEALLWAKIGEREDRDVARIQGKGTPWGPK
jgi:hypothetical protein